MANEEYHIPIIPEEPYIYVSIRDYQINNPTVFDIRNQTGKGESQLTMKLTFSSNDYSPDKFTKFFNAFNNFLDDFTIVY
ncbi:hypothetical protein [Bacillus sp. mrc49]|uniref:hypothetical protein n=1 Tax=Bacillus sp. mrc49 TaxID=2054913 RepID=UPI000C27EC0A|nr:hypothetical protein [Bacillus sp. mrc49]PJN91563.1 hypothetical protein CVN76_04350 [Bacillus sp. mrc49]